MQKYNSSGALTDESLVLCAKEGGSEALSALILRYQAQAKYLVRGYNVAGLETDDLVQEALVGLIKAVRSFEVARQVPFGAYAAFCMRHQVQSAIRAGLGSKHQPLRNYVSLDDSAELPLDTPQNNQAASPESIVISDEEAAFRTKQIKSLLSAFEQEALNLYLSGHSYEEMAKRMQSTPKSVDNALQRVRRKLRSMKLP